MTLRKRLAGAETARRRAEEAAITAESDAARAAVALADERHARRAAVEQATKLEARLAQVTTERDRARALAAEASAAAGEAAAVAEAAAQEIEGSCERLLRGAEEEMARLERATPVVVLPAEPVGRGREVQALAWPAPRPR